MTVTETIDQLRTLQIVDEGIRALENELEQLPRNLETARADLAAVEAKVAQARDSLEGIRKRRRGLEQEIAQAEQNVIKYENDKLRVKTNEEFRALNTQIERQKEIKSGLEDGVLASYDEETEAENHLGKLEEELALVTGNVETRETDMKTRAAEDEKQLDELRNRRGAAVEALEPSLLARYEAIRARKGGVAVVQVVRGACGGCHTQQPPQKVNEVRKQEALHTCDFCGRFLLWNAGEVDPA